VTPHHPALKRQITWREPVDFEGAQARFSKVSLEALDNHALSASLSA
jgi:hypothetical protein